MNRTFGDLIRTARKFAKMRSPDLTVSEVARRMGFSVGFLMHLETDFADPLSPIRTVELCEIMQVKGQRREDIIRACIRGRNSLDIGGLPEGLRSIIEDAVVKHYAS